MLADIAMSSSEIKQKVSRLHSPVLGKGVLATVQTQNSSKKKDNKIISGFSMLFLILT